MPSPFPGMDPWLEHPQRFGSLHARMPAYLSEHLKPRLPKPYFADIGERVWVEQSERYVEPDTHVLRPNTARPARPSDGGVAVAEAPAGFAPPLKVSVPDEEHRELYVDVFVRKDGGERLVTSIEILSPKNKTPGSQGQEAYHRKQNEMSDANVHLLEIDLLRGGRHTTCVPLDWLRHKAGPFDYHVCLRRFHDRPGDYLVWPVRLTERLPTVFVPLLPGDGEVPLDLQAVFDRSYDSGPYDVRIDYANTEPVPPLTPEQSAWARGVLRERGIVPAPAPSAT